MKKLGNHLVVFLVPALFFIVVSPVFTSSSLIMLVGNAVILGLFSGFTPTIIFASAPLLAKRKESIGIAMSIVIIGENVGVLIGPKCLACFVNGQVLLQLDFGHFPLPV